MSDHDLIRRGDALKAIQLGDTVTKLQARIASVPAVDADPVCTDCGGSGITYQTERRCACQTYIPAVQPTVKPLRYIEPEGETLDQMRDHARQHPLAQSGDMRLVWVNEGDLHMHTIFHAVQPTVSPELLATTNDVVALVEAAEKVRDSYWYSSDGIITGMYDLETALARVKGETK